MGLMHNGAAEIVQDHADEIRRQFGPGIEETWVFRALRVHQFISPIRRESSMGMEGFDLEQP